MRSTSQLSPAQQIAICRKDYSDRREDRLPKSRPSDQLQLPAALEAKYIRYLRGQTAVMFCDWKDNRGPG